MENQAAWKKWILSFGIFACVGSTIFASPIVQTLSEAYPDESMTTIRLITTIPSLMSFTLALAFASLVGKKSDIKPRWWQALCSALWAACFPPFGTRASARLSSPA